MVVATSLAFDGRTHRQERLGDLDGQTVESHRLVEREEVVVVRRCGAVHVFHEANSRLGQRNGEGSLVKRAVVGRRSNHDLGLGFDRFEVELAMCDHQPRRRSNWVALVCEPIQDGLGLLGLPLVEPAQVRELAPGIVVLGVSLDLAFESGDGRIDGRRAQRCVAGLGFAGADKGDEKQQQGQDSRAGACLDLEHVQGDVGVLRGGAIARARLRTPG